MTIKEQAAFRLQIASLNSRVEQLERAAHVKTQAKESPPMLKNVPELILELTASKFGVTVDQLKGRTRTDKIVLPRHVAMWLARKYLTLWTSGDIGALFNRDHGTVLYACERIDETIKAGYPKWLVRWIGELEREMLHNNEDL